MYFLNNIEELTDAKLTKIIQYFRGKELLQMEKYENYYNGRQEIASKYVSDETKPCNRITVNYCKQIVDTYAGYLTGVPISYSASEDITDIMDILKYNDYHTEDNRYLINCLKYGVAYELNYLDEEAQQRFKILDSKEIIPIYSNDLERKLLCVVRMYSANDLDDMSKRYLDIYTDTEIRHYRTDMSYSMTQLLSVEPHYYGQVPVSVFELNDERVSVFDQILSLQDAYNKLISANVDDYEAFVDAYMVLRGLTADEDDIADMKVNRVLLLDDENAEAFYLTKPDNSEGVKALISKLEEQIQKIAKCPDFTDESFGSASGIAIQYKLTGMENNCSNIEANMKEALQHRLELLCAIQRLTASDFLWRDVEIIFTRNLPVDYSEKVNMVNSLRGLVSDRTLLALLPFIKDVDKELEQVKQQEKEITTYDFSGGDDE